MDNITIFITIILIIFIFKVISSVLDNPHYKGSAFENNIYNKIIKLIDKNFVYKNIYIKRQNRRLTEIDILAIHTTGIYVFECKNYGGWIFGAGNKKEWLHTYKTGERYRFYSPIFQNQIHINAVKNLLKNYNIPYYSIIVFSDKCELMDFFYDTPNTYIIYENEIKSLMKELLSTQVIINLATLNKINQIIEQNCSKQENNHEQLMQDMAEGLTKCPYCNGSLVKRVNKKNNTVFYGCSNYPKCKYTTNKLREFI